jgi:hypothetical protein
MFSEFYPSWDPLPLLDPSAFGVLIIVSLSQHAAGHEAISVSRSQIIDEIHKSGYRDLLGPDARSNKKLLRTDMMKLQYSNIIRAGAIFSSSGTALLILFLIILLSFPIEKDCSKHQRCEFYSEAPEPLNYLVSPNFVVITLFVISAGVLVMRLARRYSNRV